MQKAELIQMFSTWLPDHPVLQAAIRRAARLVALDEKGDETNRLNIYLNGLIMSGLLSMVPGLLLDNEVQEASLQLDNDFIDAASLYRNATVLLEQAELHFDPDRRLHFLSGTVLYCEGDDLYAEGSHHQWEIQIAAPSDDRYLSITDSQIVHLSWRGNLTRLENPSP